MKKLPEHILCHSDMEIIECAKFLKKLGYRVFNFDGKDFIRCCVSDHWMGMTFVNEDDGWGRFHTKNLTEYIEFKYLLRKDKLKKLQQK